MVRDNESGGGGWVEAIVDRAIEADMTWRGYAGDVVRGFFLDWGIGPYHTVTGPSGPDRSGAVVWEDMHGPMGPDAIPFDVVSWVYTYWQDKVRELYRPWADLPTGDQYDAQIAAATETIRLLASQGATEDGQGGIALGNPRLDRIETIKGEVAPFKGATMDAFFDQVAVPLSNKVRSQHTVATIVGAALYAEQQLWVKSYADLVDLQNKAHDAMAAAKRGGGGGGDGTGTFLKVAGSVAAAVGLFVTGGTGAAVIGGAATVIGLLDTWLPEEPERKVTTSGLNPEEVFSSMNVALTSLRDQIAAEEYDLQGGLDDVAAQTVSDVNQFTFAPGRNPLSDATGDEQVLTYDRGTLRRIAHQYMPIVAGELAQARSQASSTLGASAWHRNGELGLDASNPYESFAKVVHRLQVLLDKTGGQISMSAELLMIAVNDIDATDAEVDQAIRKQAVKIGQG